MSARSVTVFAPASVANLGVGFDALGLAFPVLGDEVTATRSLTPGVHIDQISLRPGILVEGLGTRDAGAGSGTSEGDARSADAADERQAEDGDGMSDAFPTEPERNTASAGLLALARDTGVALSVGLSIKKGIPLGSGLGGSAASAAAAILAVDRLYEFGLSENELVRYATIGESVASGSLHADNVAPSLLGGLVLCRYEPSFDVIRLPLPTSLHIAIVYPGFRLDTAAARAVLAKTVPLKLHVAQSTNLASLVVALQRGDMELLRRSLKDLIIEPQRAGLIPGFSAIQGAALGLGALGSSISGAGPSIFALCDGEAAARQVLDGMLAEARRFHPEARGYAVPARGQGGARVVNER